MKLSVSNIAWSPDQRLEAYALLRDHAVSGLEFAPGLLFPDLAAPLEATALECEQVLLQLAEFGLRPSSMQSLLFGADNARLFGSPLEQEALQDAMKGAIRLAARLGCENLVFGSPKNRVIPADMTKAQAEAIWRDSFFRMGDAAAAAGVVIALEPNPVQYGTNFMTCISDTLDVVKSLDHPAIRMNLDLGAAIMTHEIETFETWLPAALSVSNHVHLSTPELAPLSTQVPVVRHAAGVLDAAGWHKWISVEMRGGIPALSDSLTSCFGPR